MAQKMHHYYRGDMAKVEAFLNSGDFPSRAGGGLEALAQALHRRCARVVELQGGRLRT